jgi:phosphoglycolate phosphatase-like HAD superfamily hydrolase
MRKIVLIDLDGTLVDTAKPEFKNRKDGIEATNVDDIPIIEGAKEFVAKLIELKHEPIIISDSHPNYVQPIAKQIFNLRFLSLADKPNITKTKDFLSTLWSEVNYSEHCIVVGDTWLDIELGRGLNCPTILALFYENAHREVRDGIGNSKRHIKSGPTYVVNSFERILEIIKQPIEHLLAAEAIFHNVKSKRSRKFSPEGLNSAEVAYRCLGRQNSGECDKYGIADKYFEFQRPNRSPETVKLLAQAVANYLEFVMKETVGFKWDAFTYVSDKKTTSPPNKMSELFELVDIDIIKEKLFFWKQDIPGSIRDQETFNDRSNFVSKYLFVTDSIDLKDKNVIIIDDQYTTGGTANAISGLLKEKGVKNIFFITLFYLIDNVQSDKTCPKCQKRMVVKIKRADGQKFLSCLLPKFGGDGCGYISNL